MVREYFQGYRANDDDQNGKKQVYHHVVAATQHQ